MAFPCDSTGKGKLNSGKSSHGIPQLLTTKTMKEAIKLKHPIWDVELYPDNNAVIILNHYGEHVGFNVVDGSLKYADASNGDFTESDDSIDDIENQVNSWYREESKQ